MFVPDFTDIVHEVLHQPFSCTSSVGGIFQVFLQVRKPVEIRPTSMASQITTRFVIKYRSSVQIECSKGVVHQNTETLPTTLSPEMSHQAIFSGKASTTCPVYTSLAKIAVELLFPGM
jgi:hypothetical protein